MFQVLDVAALWIIWWCAASGLAGAPDERTWKVAVLKLALLVVSLSSFVGAVTLYVQAQPIRWWASGFLYGVAVVSAWLYDYRFGVRRQWEMARTWLRSIPARARDRLRRRHP